MYFGKEKLFVMVESVFKNQWSEKWPTWLNIFDASSLCVVDLVAASVLLTKSATKHNEAAKGVFAELSTVARVVIGYYYRSFVHSDLYGHR